MSSATEQTLLRPEDQERIRLAREVVAIEAAALGVVSERLGVSFCRAADVIFESAKRQGCVIVTGMGKAGLIGQKIAATLSSTGSRAHTLHPSEALHGDLGRVGPHDVVLALSYSGETEEVIRIIPSVKKMGARLVAITAQAQSRLARQSDVAIVLGPIEEACPLRLAPSASTTAMMAIGDALAFVLSRMRNFQAEHFAEFHPGGNLGRLTAPVESVMRTGDQLRIADYRLSVREALVESHRHGRRTGALLLVDEAGILKGIFTDADLVRLLEQHREADLDVAIATLMNKNPTTIEQGNLVRDAMVVLSSRKFSQLPVLDSAGRPVGILDITDLIGLLPQTESLREPSSGFVRDVPQRHAA